MLLSKVFLIFKYKFLNELKMLLLVLRKITQPNLE